MKKKLLEVTTRSGKAIEVDISDEACQPFGFKHGETLIDLGGYDGIVLGVAPIPCSCIDCKHVLGQNALWYYSTHGCARGVGFYRTEGEVDLRTLGFRLKE